MKLNSVEKLILNFTLDSSEAIMFGKGGRHTICLTGDEKWDLNEYDEIEVNFQIERIHQDRMNFIENEAQQARQRRYEEAVKPL